MTLVTAAEHRLITLVQAAMGGGSAEAHRLLPSGHAVPEGFSPPAQAALERSFSVGLVRALAEGGGARAAEGQRLWHRLPAPDLPVTAYAVQLTLWALREPLALSDRPACPLLPSGAAGDVAFTFLLARLLVAAGLRDVLAERVFRENTFVQLAFAHHLALAPAAAPQGKAPVFPGRGVRLDPEAALAQPALILGFSRYITAAILDGELPTATVANAVIVADRRRLTFESYLAACAQHRQWQAVDPLVDAAITAMRRPPPAALADPAAPLRDRAAAARATTVLATLTLQLHQHAEALARLDFFDDGYAEAQATRRRWAGLDRARAVAEARILATAGV